MRRFSLGNTDPQGIVIGQEAGSKRPVLLSGKARTTHMEILGASGLGKTRFMEHMIREDILAGRGLCLIDPTGNLYDDIVAWLARHPDLDVPVILLNAGEEQYVTGYNPIRRSRKDVEFLVDDVINAIARVWGEADLQSTPLLKRCLKLIFTALAERGLSLAEARHFIDPDAKDFRAFLVEPLKGSLEGNLWAFYNERASDRQFFEDFSSTVNRLLDFSADRLQRIFGQTEHAIDVRQVLDQGAVLLVNLGSRKISREAARLLGTLLVYDLFLTALERPRDSPPFYLYVDECYDFVNEDIGLILDRCRQFGLHAVLAHQHLAQLKRAGETVYMAMRTDTKVKVVFGGLVPEEASLVAQQVHMGEFDPDEIKHELHRTFEHHRLTWLDIRTTMQSHTSADGQQHGTQAGTGSVHALLPDGGLFGSGSPGATSLQNSSGVSDGISRLEGDTDAESVTRAPMLLPEEDTELSGVQFRNLEEQLYRAMVTMINQPAQQAVLKVLTGRTCVIETPTIPTHNTPADVVRDYELGRYKAVPFCVPTMEAERLIADRTTNLLQEAASLRFARSSLPDLHSTPDHEPPPTRQPGRGATVALKPATRKAKASPGKGGSQESE